ncbi:MAG: 50S ribosomal protein L29 [Candidatus Fonsibacter sp.]
MGKVKEEQVEARLKKKNGQVTNTASIKTNRRAIATVKTFINLNRAK